MANILCISTVFLLEVLFVLADRKCDKWGVLLYEDMGCTPKAKNQSTGCPIEYKCPNWTPVKDRCYYKNMVYKVNEPVRHNDVFCDFGCFCEENGNFVCPVVDCAEYFGIPPNPGCYRTYSLNKCCSDGEQCSQCSGTCRFDGQTYRFGERFYPKKSCSICVCQRGFRGRIEEPYCTSRKCNVQLKRDNGALKKCAPLYLYEPNFENNILCCPSLWICPNETDVIHGSGIPGGKKCYFGSRTLELGQRIERDTGSLVYGTAICECRLPPFLTCIPKKHYPLLV